MALAFALLFLLLASPVVYAVDHIVGGSSGWSLSSSYDSWAAGQTFNVGDKLVFNYGGSHGLDAVSQDDYDNCATGNAITSYSDNPTTITLSKPGPMYFICPSFGHCVAGMKLAITVQGTGGPGGTDNPPSGTDNPSTTPSTPGSIFPPSRATPATRNTPTEPNSATGSFGSIKLLMLGFSLVFAAVVCA